MLFSCGIFFATEDIVMSFWKAFFFLICSIMAVILFEHFDPIGMFVSRAFLCYIRIRKYFESLFGTIIFL